MLKITLIFLLSTITLSVNAQNTVSSRGMTAKWKLNSKSVEFELFAPDDGWIAIGFNSENELTGSDLYMTRIRNGKASGEYHYIYAPGDHREANIDRIISISGQETVKGTSIKLVIKSTAMAPHHKLIKGKTYYMIIAYSQSDDFDHHSIHRASIKVKL